MIRGAGAPARTPGRVRACRRARRRCARRSGPGWPGTGTPSSRCGPGGRCSPTADGPTRRGRWGPTAGVSPPRSRPWWERSCCGRGWWGRPTDQAQTMGAPVLLEMGTDDQRARWLRALATGAEAWCQFFSEPGAGTDLASVQTRAERDGDEWVVNGQKVWTGGAQYSDRGILVVRTDADKPKHRGLSFFVIDVDQPGIEIRPLRQMNDAAALQRGVLHRRPGARRQPRRRPRQRLGGGHGHPGPRAHRLRRRQRARAHGHARGEGRVPRPVLPGGARAPRGPRRARPRRLPAGRHRGHGGPRPRARPAAGSRDPPAHRPAARHRRDGPVDGPAGPGQRPRRSRPRAPRARSATCRG